MFTFSEIKEAHFNIRNNIIETPLIHLSGLSEKTGAHIYLKLENKQIGGSVKTRAAFTKVASICDRKRSLGFSTASSGNHGISMSIACGKNNIPLNLFVPQNTPVYKINKLRSLGAKLTLVGHSWDDANSEAYIYARKSGSSYVHAFEDRDILKGHATAALEVIRQLPAVNVMVCSIGGGGIISAFSEVIKMYSSSAKCYGVETLGAHSISLSLSKGCPAKLNKITSLAQSIAVQSPTELTFNTIRKNVEGVVLVSDFEAQISQKEIYHQTGELLELAASCSVAAVAKNGIPNLRDQNVVILS